MPSTSYHIRLAHIADLPRLREVEVEAGKRFISMGLIDHLLGESMCREKLSDLINKEQVWVACLEKELVGFAATSILKDMAYLEEMDVIPEHGGRGVGTRLVKMVCEWACQQGLTAVVLSTFEAVAWNAPFYERLGFKHHPRAKWSSEMRQMRNAERKAGLPIEKRIFMLLDLQSST